MWNPELEQTHSYLSPADLRFRKQALGDRELLDRGTFKSLAQADNALFRYRLQSWPTFMDREVLGQFAEISVEICRLVRSVPQRIFGGDCYKICEYFDLENPYLVELMLSEPNGIGGAFSRGDFVYGDSGFKCLEFNLTSSLGGWESALIAQMQMEVPAIRRFIDELDGDISAVNTVRMMFIHTIKEAIEKGVATWGEVNTAIGIRDPIGDYDSPISRTLFEREYLAALKEVDSNLTGRAFFCEYPDLTDKKGGIYYNGRRVHALIERHQAPSDPRVFKAFKSLKLNLYNGPTSLVLSDKRILALLSEHEESSVYTAEERQIIHDYIPWTRRLLPGNARLEGVEVQLEAYVLAQRERMVMKKGRSLGGADVVIGRFSTDEEWAKDLRRNLDSGDWVVQEFVESRPYLYQNGEYGCSEHDVVWGPFVLGDTYAGTILRLQPKTWEGIVNLTRGATEGMIFEFEAGESEAR